MQTPQDRKPIAGSEPNYSSFRNQPEHIRWQWYEHAKQVRKGQQSAGVEMTETYDQFIDRITRELEI